MPEMREGLDLSKIGEITPEEVDANLTAVWRWRGPLYEMYANSLMLDYAPDFAKLHRWASDMYGRPEVVNVITLSTQNIHTYMMTGWETGILNEFHTLRRNGVTKAQLMELVMFTQLYAGMRGLGHVYHAVGNLLPVWEDPKDPAPWPEGWAADPEAFKSGLDLTTRQMTPEDVSNLTAWYEKTIGYLPDSIAFGLKHHPEFVKVHRAKWETALRTVPKQVAPYMMLRHNTITGSREGLREAALLGKAWGITPEWIVKGITNTAFYFTGFEGLYTAHAAIEDIL
ncbi:MAG TPA: hypothetical protein VFX19_08145 [Dehalococcoidia bacterium]|jgi:hypothetical protein|nr:hypothetical protein [Dehalococcoidia bacterium]